MSVTSFDDDTKHAPAPLSATRRAMQRFMRLESSGGILLILASIMAMICANSVLAETYNSFLDTHLTLEYGDIGLSKSLKHWINDGLMAIFFLLVGMEIKRELKEGELSSFGQAMLPFFAAAGGMAMPAVIFSYINWGDKVAMAGWAIPSATDIAFSLAILGLFGTRAPISLKIFLTAVAVIDDLGAIVIIALFYSHHMVLPVLGIAAICIAILLWMNLKGVNKYGPYLVVGLIMWVAVLESGVHATLAGVILGFMIPLNVKGMNGESMLKYMEHALHHWVAYAVLPIFAFANAGVSFAGLSLGNLADPVPLGIALGLFLGKQWGIFLVCFILIKLKFARLPDKATWLQFYGVCIICGIGFTMSLFIGELAYARSEHLSTETKLGVMLGSLLSALVGYIFMAIVLPRKRVDLPDVAQSSPAT